mmetsp:Transcript_23170/g.71613  ORF Transcript_23170/g.71613 Transcript_23170/m.71613 type:complete len:432 (-) Transcript_23170:35-1330(-)
MSLPLTADLEGAAGFRSVKDESSKEPALVVRRGLCCRYVACVALALAAAAGAIWQSDAALKALAPELAARRAKFRLSQHNAHSRFTALGQELEQHLEADMREREVALKLRARIRLLEKTHRLNVTRALDAAAIGAPAVTFEARDAVKPYLEDAVDALFEEMRQVLEARILQPMVASGSAANARHDALHDEVLEELRQEKKEREIFLKKKHELPGDLDGDGFVEDTTGDGVADQRWVDEAYDEQAAAKRDEQWRTEVVEHFSESFARHFNDSANVAEGLEPRALLTEADPLYGKLVEIGDAIGYPGAWDVSSNETAPKLTWREAEAKLKELEPLLKKHRCHAFEPSEPPEDDEYDYMQIHNVEHYVSEMKWHAKLNGKKDEVVKSLADHASGALSAMDLVEKLETLEGDRVFPSFWLFHAPGAWDDYRYGDW